MSVRLAIALVVAGLALASGASLQWGARDARKDSPPAGGPRDVDWSAALEGVTEDGFRRPAGPWRLTLPADHGAHPSTRTESWIFSAHLEDAGGQRLGFQLALARVAIVAPTAAERASAWATRSVIRAHALLVGEDADRATSEERFGRTSLGLAGYDASERRVWIEDWSLGYGKGAGGENLSIEARMGDVELSLTVSPEKRAVTVDEERGSAPFRGYAQSRLMVKGTLRRASDVEPVTGLAWLDHAWGEVPWPTGPVVWDRLQLQLDDGSDLSILRTRRRDGRGGPRVSGFLVSSIGDVHRLPSEALQMIPIREWQSPRTGIRYPLGWQLSGDELDLEVRPLHEHQAHDFALPMWSGLVIANGRLRGQPVSGTGFLELTGYEGR